jgi:hypothetical protein
MKAKAPAQTLAEYDEEVVKDAKLRRSGRGRCRAWCRWWGISGGDRIQQRLFTEDATLDD